MAPAASQLTFDDKASSIFRVEHSEFVKMDSRTIQEIFRDRHILVVNVPSPGIVRFDEEGFQMLSDIDREVTVQCSSILIISQTISFLIGLSFSSLYCQIPTDGLVTTGTP